jgi:2-polyprenyl-3-methyl-5-hydroxy-6-metoxy-1,4-benzoquinol methylase
MNLFQFGTVDTPRYYKSRRDMSVAGLHEAITPLVVGPTVLDLGSGEGALSQRLRDAGHFVDESNDIDFDTPNWSVAFHKYDSIISTEVIEHLKCPWNFISEASKLVKPGGQLLISTPNIENPISKVIFLLRGQYFLFGPSELKYGHISPLTEFQIRNICQANKMEMEKVVLAGVYPIIYFHRNIKDTIIWSLIALVGMFSKNKSPCKIYCMRRGIHD